MIYIRSIDEILERIEYEKKYSEAILNEGMTKLQTHNNEGAWIEALTQHSLSNERLNTLKWIIDEFNLDRVDV
jgi:hypothetical protein